MSRSKYSSRSEIGKIYGYLKVLEFFPFEILNGKQLRARALVKCCRCNSEPFIIFHANMAKQKSQPTVSCGCLQKDRAREVGVQRESFKTHGLYNHPYYKTCVSAINRCEENFPNRCNYYDRGIRCFWTVETIPDFIRYLDTLPARKPKQSLDRIDNDRGYEPGNLRWATAKEQIHNKRPPIKNYQFDQLKKQLDDLKIKYTSLITNAKIDTCSCRVCTEVRSMFI